MTSKLLKRGTCKSCLREKKLVAKELCHYCYAKTISRECASCGKLSVIHGRNLCYNCYYKHGVNKVRIICSSCGMMVPHYASGKCRKCYNKEMNRKIKSRNPEHYTKSVRLFQNKRRSKVRSSDAGHA